MNEYASRSKRSAFLCVIKTRLIAVLLPVFVLLPGVQSGHADSATWNLDPGSGDWNTAANWSPATIPNRPTDTATFASSNITDISLSAETTVSGITFDPAASPFTISTGQSLLTIGNAGVTNSSSITQNFVVANHSALYLRGSATAGSETVFTNTGSTETSGQGFIVFFGTSSAGDATFINEPGLANQGGGGYMQFADRSTAGNGIFINQGSGVAGSGIGYIEFGGVLNPGSNAGNGQFTLNGGTASSAFGGQINFYCFTSAADGNFTIDGASVSGALPGIIYFFCDATADHATLVAKGGLNGGPGGSIHFAYQALGGKARVVLSGNSTLDISLHDAPGMSIGSIEGEGTVFLGGNALSVGTNNRDMTFAGLLQDGGDNGGVGGSLTKIGKGMLVISSSNDYTGDTHVESGGLLVKNATGSATGSGNVYVDRGRLGGTGIIGGAVTVGTGSGHKVALAPGQAGTLLSIEKSLTFNSDGKCQIVLNSDTGTAGGVIAQGVTINSASFFIQDNGDHPSHRLHCYRNGQYGGFTNRGQLQQSLRRLDRRRG